MRRRIATRINVISDDTTQTPLVSCIFDATTLPLPNSIVDATKKIYTTQCATDRHHHRRIKSKDVVSWIPERSEG